MPNRHFLSGWGILFLLLSVSSAFAQNRDSLLDAALKKYVESFDPPSVVMGVSLNGRYTWKNAAGIANLEHNSPATVKSVYRFASISKLITAVAIMQLVEQGKVNLDADVRQYLPFYPKKKFPFTVRQILNHTSGVRSYKNNEFHSTREFSSTTDVITYLSPDSLMYQPGTATLYSTLSYALLAGVIESVSKRSYDAYLREFIFKPAGMTDTRTENRKQILPNRAAGYVRNTTREFEHAPLADLSIKFPGGGITGTVEDLLNFGRALLEGKLIKKSSLELMTRPTFLINGQKLNYGLGVSIQTDSLNRFSFGHNGAGTGFMSSLMMYPSENLVTAYITNINDRAVRNGAEICAWTVLNNTVPEMSPPMWDQLMRVYRESGVMQSLLLYTERKTSGLASTDDLVQFGKDLTALRKTDDALRVLKQAAEEAPKLLSVQLALAAAYRADNNKGMASRHYRNALKLDPDNQEAARGLKELQR